MSAQVKNKYIYVYISGQRGGGRQNLAPPPFSLLKGHKLEKKWSENASERVNFQNFLTQGKGLDPNPTQSRPFGPRRPPFWNPLPAPGVSN